MIYFLRAYFMSHSYCIYKIYEPGIKCEHHLYLIGIFHEIPINIPRFSYFLTFLQDNSLL